MDEHDVEENEVRLGRTYTYEKTGDNTGIITKPYADGTVDTYSLVFNSTSAGVITDDSNRSFTLERTEPNPKTVVSDPNGKAVVVQVGDEYKWSSTLNGVTLWGVEQSSNG